MEERILVPLDGTEVGEAVLPKLEQLVFRTVPVQDVEVTLLQVISRVNFNVLTTDERAQLPIPADELVKLTAESESYLQGVAEGMRDKGINVKTMIMVGHPAEEIVKAARNIDAHLIAMSTRGKSGFVRWAIGSVTDKVMRLEGKIPVLAVNSANKKEKNTVVPLESLQSLVKHS